VSHPSDMDSWYDIVKSYDDPKGKNPTKKDDGTYSQSSVVILLIYLTFGDDYPYNIAKYFNRLLHEPFNPDLKIPPYSSNLRTAKVGTLLNQMNEDDLVTLIKKKVKGRLTKYYSINPRILQSPIQSETYFKPDGSLFKIPSETIEDLLGWLALKETGNGDNEQGEKLRQGRRNQAERIIRVILFNSKSVDYLSYLLFIQAEARNWYSLKELNNRQPSLNALMSDYIHGVDKASGDYYNGKLLMELDIAVISQHL
jgi:hypothetical protein